MRRSGALRLTAAITALAPATVSAMLATASALPVNRQDTPCSAQQLDIGALGPITGDPGPAGGYTSWNIALRNTGPQACLIGGWPEASIYSDSGHIVPTTFIHGSYNDVQFVPSRDVLLTPGSSAVVTVLIPDHYRGCVSGWKLALTPAGHQRPVTVPPQAPVRSLCVGGQVQLSPYYRLTALRTAIKDLARPASQPAYPASRMRMPSRCTAAALRSAVLSQAGGPAGSTITLSLRSVRRCVLATGGWPTVRLNVAGGTGSPRAPGAGAARSGTRGTVAKALDDMTAMRSGVAPFVSYVAASGEESVLMLAPGRPVSVVLALTRSARAAACRSADSATIFPAPATVGHGLLVRLRRPARFCDQVRALPYLSGRRAAHVASIAAGGLRLADAAAHPSRPAGANQRPPEFWHGSDGPMNMACRAPSGGGSYLESASPKNGAGGLAPSRCPYGTHGSFGGYLGELGRWEIWKHCDADRPPWNASDYDAAQLDLTTYHQGAGAAAYWMLGGPGRSGEPSSPSADWNWGRLQAKRAAAEAGPHVLGLPYLFADIEQYSGGLDSGWHRSFNGRCRTGRGGMVTQREAASVLDGFRSYIRNRTPYLPGVYSSGAGGSYSWRGIFGSQVLADTAEWTYSFQTRSYLTFPRGWHIPRRPVSPVWFGGSPAPRCHLIWQWIGGTGRNRTYQIFRADQIRSPAPGPGCR